MDGWDKQFCFSNPSTRTCLHWACKRNHKHIVSYLLGCGADKEILTAKEELASQLTSKPEIKRLLGGLFFIFLLFLSCSVKIPGVICLNLTLCYVNL